MNVYTLKDFIRNEDKNSALKLQIFEEKMRENLFYDWSCAMKIKKCSNSKSEGRNFEKLARERGRMKVT